MMEQEFEFGIYSLGERIPGPSGQTVSAKDRIDEIIAAAKLADEAGLDLFRVGEHHRLDFVTSSYAMILSAIAQATKNIRLTSTFSEWDNSPRVVPLLFQNSIITDSFEYLRMHL